jgi:amidase
MTDLGFRTAADLAAATRRGVVGCRELLDHHLARVERLNPRINAIVARYDDEARARARGPIPAGPLAGVPFLVKDLLATWKGHPYTASSRLLEGWIAPASSEVIVRLERAGLVLFGQTNTPEFGILGTTEPAMRGPTRNPWNPERSTGGSSGGSAAALAARIVPAAHGNDGGGSLRIPASGCGLFALKPTRGRVSRYRAARASAGSPGRAIRAVRDSAALLDAIAEPAPGDPYAAPPAARPFSAEVGAPSGTLRIAVTPDPLFGLTSDVACREAVYDAARLLSGLGHDVVEAHPQVPRDALVHAYLVALAATVAADVHEAAGLWGAGPTPSSLRPWRRRRRARAHRRRLVRRGGDAPPTHDGRVLEEHDVLVTSPGEAAHSHRRARAQPWSGSRSGPLAGPSRSCSSAPSRDQRQVFRGHREHHALNQTGQPAVTVPPIDRRRPPVGTCQIVDRFGDEPHCSGSRRAERPPAGRSARQRATLVRARLRAATRSYPRSRVDEQRSPPRSRTTAPPRASIAATSARAMRMDGNPVTSRESASGSTRTSKDDQRACSRPRRRRSERTARTVRRASAKASVAGPDPCARRTPPHRPTTAAAAAADETSSLRRVRDAAERRTSPRKWKLGIHARRDCTRRDPARSPEPRPPGAAGLACPRRTA